MLNKAFFLQIGLILMNFDNAVWLVGILTEAVLIGLLAYRRVWHTLPVFCSYLVWDVLSNIVAFAVSRFYPSHYFQVYLAETIVDSALLFCVLVELAWSVLRPLRASLSRMALVAVSALILIAGAAIWPFAGLQGIKGATSSAGLLYAQLQQTTSILRILFFLVLAGGCQLLSISWRDRELQVATGLGLYSLVSLTAAMVNLHQTTASQYQHLAQFVTASYICCLIYWTVSFAQKEAERREFTPQMQKFLLAVAGAARSTRVALHGPHSNKPPRPDGC
jgi:hypothetical protein